MKMARCSRSVVICELVFVLLLLARSSLSAEECKPKEAGVISGEGTNAGDAKDNFYDKAHSKCYELCKPLDCTDAKKRCMHDGLTLDPSHAEPSRDRPKHFTMKATVGCKCRCDTCDGSEGREFRKIVAHQQFNAEGDKPSEVEKEAEEKAKAWCQENECARFPCDPGKTCKAVKVATRGVHPRPPGTAKWTVGRVLLSCTCKCE